MVTGGQLVFAVARASSCAATSRNVWAAWAAGCAGGRGTRPSARWPAAVDDVVEVLAAGLCPDDVADREREQDAHQL